MIRKIQFQNGIEDENLNSPNSKYGSHCQVGANFLPFLNFFVIIFLDIGLSAGSRHLNPPAHWELPEVDRLCRSGEVDHFGVGGPPRCTRFL
jgi:hypothetical protein